MIIKSARNHKIPLLLATTALLCGATEVSADFISATFNQVSPSGKFVVSGDGGANFTTVNAGVFNWTRTGGDYNGGGAEGDFVTFCIEVFEHVAPDTNYDFEVWDLADAPDSIGGMGQGNADLMAELFGRYYDDGFGQADALAFQAAVWEITYDDGMEVETGDFQIAVGENITQDILDQAQSWLSTLDGMGPMAPLGAMVADGVQDQVFIMPTPGSVVLLASGSLLAIRRKRR